MKVWRQEKRYGVSFFSQSVKSVTELEEFSRRASQYAKQTVESCHLDQNKRDGFTVPSVFDLVLEIECSTKSRTQVRTQGFVPSAPGG